MYFSFVNFLFHKFLLLLSLDFKYNSSCGAIHHEAGVDEKKESKETYEAVAHVKAVYRAEVECGEAHEVVAGNRKNHLVEDFFSSLGSLVGSHMNVKNHIHLENQEYKADKLHSLLLE
jgi:hypothetical protein